MERRRGTELLPWRHGLLFCRGALYGGGDASTDGVGPNPFRSTAVTLRQALKGPLRVRSFKQTIDAFESGCAGSRWALLQIDQIFGKPCGFGLSLLIEELPLYWLRHGDSEAVRLLVQHVQHVMCPF